MPMNSSPKYYFVFYQIPVCDGLCSCKVCVNVFDWVSDGVMFWFGVKTHLRKTKVLGNKVKNRLNSMRIHLNRTDPL